MPALAVCATLARCCGEGVVSTDQAGLPAIAVIPQAINLNGVIGIPDSGIVHLRGMNNLASLCLNGTRITYAGVAKLQKALPNCKISK